MHLEEQSEGFSLIGQVNLTPTLSTLLLSGASSTNTANHLPTLTLPKAIGSIVDRECVCPPGTRSENVRLHWLSGTTFSRRKLLVFVSVRM